MFGRKSMDDYIDEEEWEFDNPNDSSPVSSYGDFEHAPESFQPSFEEMPPIIAEKPSFFDRGNFGFSLSLPSNHAFIVISCCLLIVLFGVIGAFGTSFKHPKLLSYSNWKVHKYLKNVGNIEQETVNMPSTLNQLSAVVSQPLALSNQIQVDDQKLSQLYLATQRVSSPNGYKLFNTTLETTIEDEITALNAYQTYISTGQKSDEQTWETNVAAMSKEVAWLKTEWAKVGR